MGGDDDADRAIDARELLDGEDVLDVAEAGAAVFVGKDAAHESQLAELPDGFEGKVRGFVPLLHVGGDLAGGKVAHHALELELFLGELKVHASSGD